MYQPHGEQGLGSNWIPFCPWKTFLAYSKPSCIADIENHSYAYIITSSPMLNSDGHKLTRETNSFQVTNI